MNLPALLLAAAAPALSMAAFLAIALPLRRQRKRRERRSPLSFDVKHLPGERAREQLAALEEDAGSNAAGVVMAGPIFLCVYLASRIDPDQLRFEWFELLMLLSTLALVATLAIRLSRNAVRRQQLTDGMRAEIATAQELAPLAARGYAVVHNVAGEGFDIDHVVVGPCCVWTIESKSRRKPRAQGKHNARVVYDGTSLRFPDWSETRPLDQARAQARWLADYLRGRNGEPVEVRPVLSLPGWFVDQTARADVIVASARGLGERKFFVTLGERRLDDAARTRIVAALRERVGSVVDGSGA